MAFASSVVVRPRQEQFTPEQMITAITSSKGLVTVAARQLQCDPQTIRNYAKRYASVRDALKEQREGMADLAEARLFQAIDRGEPWAIRLFLMTVAKERGYVESIDQNIKASVGHYIIDIGPSDDSSATPE